MKYDWFNSLEDFINWDIRANKGTQTYFTRNRIETLYKELYPDTSIKTTFTKDYMIDEIIKKKSLLEIYNEYKEVTFGIKPSKWIDKFNLTSHQRKKMEGQGYLLHVVYYNYEKVFTGTYASVPYYRAEDYFSHTIDDVERWKQENIRGYARECI
jgi:hypothetical protein